MAVVTSGLVAEYIGKYAAPKHIGLVERQSGYDEGNNDHFVGSLFTMTEAGTVSKLTGYLTNNLAVGVPLKGCIYTPQSDPTFGGQYLVAATPEYTIAASFDGPQDLVFTTGVHLDAGSYFFGYHIGNAGGVGFRQVWAGGVGVNTQAFQYDLYSDGTLAELPPAATYNNTFNVYATYIPDSGAPYLPGDNNDTVHRGVWLDTVGTHPLGNAYGFSWTGSSGWCGTGAAGDPYSIQFDGLDTTMDETGSGLVDADGDWTLEAWVWHPASLSAYYETWVSLFDPAAVNPEISMRLNDRMNGDPWGHYCDGNNSEVMAQGNSDLRDVWAHVVLSKSGTTLQQYVDSGTDGNDVTSSYPTAVTALLIGCNAWGTSREFHTQARLATLRVYTRALSPTEVTQNFTAGILASWLEAGGSTPDRSSLIAFGIA